MKKEVIVMLLTGIFALGTAQISMADYTIGSKGPEVRTIQKRLNVYGFKVKADGNYNWATSKAVKQFQKRRHLAVDGIVGPMTYKALTGKAMVRPAAPARSSSYHGDSSLGIDDSRVEWHKAGPMSDTVRAITAEAQKYVGVPYVFGGTTPRGFDCSGFIQYVFNRKGIMLPRGADEQYLSGRKVSINALEPGDLVFFQTYDQGVSHSGLYLGDGYFISATSSRGVAVATMKNGYWHDRYIGANRVL
ncbi:C40 family peptidase [uncultured Dialister sp.]|jgi:cell wall-associated NlpC family hydrolase|uniref:C40 family peptidase n=1 Tax=Dialister sp. TaxID=1955814 RepID=UPI0025EF40E2|nr:NlpC/P60 family protein [uncultured Dialister sp.]